MKLARMIIGLLLLGLSFSSHAVLDIAISGAGEHQTPIAIMPFDGEDNLKQSISDVIKSDLTRSGLFKLVEQEGKMVHGLADLKPGDWPATDALVVGNVGIRPHGRITVHFSLLDVVKQAEIYQHTITGSKAEFRMLAHHIADAIYQQITGDPGAFATHIAYVSKQGKTSKLIIADSDGDNEQTIFESDSNIMSPAWSPDGSYLAFVTFEDQSAVIYVQSILTRQRLKVAAFPESDSAPAWSPDGQQLAFVISHEGSSHIYLIQADGSGLQQLTFGNEIDTEPNFSPDGESIIFSSDRGGTVQTYRMSVDGGDAERLTFEEGNIFSPHYSPDSKSFVCSAWREGKFYIATEDFLGKQMTVISEGGWGRSPSFSPNGKIILYSSEENGHSVLKTVSVDGRVRQQMTPQQGDVFDPVWGPQSRR